MINTQEPVENFQQLYDDVKKYVLLQTEYVKVEFVEKLTILLSTLLVIGLIIVLVIIALFYLFFSIAYAVEPLVGSLSMSFGIISVVYAVLIVFLVLLRKRLVVSPLARFLTDLFLTKNQ
jgi:hypothetical protein